MSIPETKTGTRIGSDDPLYRAVVNKRFNKRFTASPDYVRLVSTTNQIVSAVEEALGEGKRLVATSGGHCLEGFVSDPEVRVIFDVSPMKASTMTRKCEPLLSKLAPP